RPAQLLVAPQGLGRIAGGAVVREARGQGRAVLDRLRGALTHERIHRMARVAEQGDATNRPARQRLTVEERPDEARVRRGADAADLRMPALEPGERAAGRRAIGPVLPPPRFVLGLA